MAFGKDHIAKQRALIAKMDKSGYDATTSRKILRTLEELLTLHESDRDRLMGEIRKQESPEL